MTNRNSTQIAELVAIPNGRLNAGEGEGVLKSATGFVASGAADALGGIQRFVRVPTNAIIREVRYSSDSAATAGAIDIGVYHSVGSRLSPTGAAIDADLFASALALTGAAQARVDVTGESGQYALNERSLPLWRVLGFPEDPDGYFDIASTITTAFNAGPTAQVLEVQYIVAGY